MKQSAILTTASLLTILFMTLHLTGDILFRMSPAGLGNLFAVLIFVVQLYGTLVLGGRRAGYIIIFLGSVLGLVIPVSMTHRFLRSGIIFIVVDLPEPFGPRFTCPFAGARTEADVVYSVMPLKFLETFRNSSMVYRRGCYVAYYYMHLHAARLAFFRSGTNPALPAQSPRTPRRPSSPNTCEPKPPSFFPQPNPAR